MNSLLEVDRSLCLERWNLSVLIYHVYRLKLQDTLQLPRHHKHLLVQIACKALSQSFIDGVLSRCHS